MASEQSRLLPRDEFIQVRDSMSLDRMLKRGDELWDETEAILLEARALRKRMMATDKRYRHAIEEEYTKLITAWASMDSELGDIQRDARYVAWQGRVNLDSHHRD